MPRKLKAPPPELSPTELDTYKHLLAQEQAKAQKLADELDAARLQIGKPVRTRLPDTRHAITHKFSVGGHEGYLIVGLFENGSPGELFITMAKEGSTIGGLMDTIGRLTSMALQYGVTVETLAEKFRHQRFEPCGYTQNPEINTASSIIDYVFRWMEIQFVQSRKVSEKETPNVDTSPKS